MPLTVFKYFDQKHNLIWDFQNKTRMEYRKSRMSGSRIKWNLSCLSSFLVFYVCPEKELLHNCVMTGWSRLTWLSSFCCLSVSLLGGAGIISTQFTTQNSWLDQEVKTRHLSSSQHGVNTAVVRSFIIFRQNCRLRVSRPPSWTWYFTMFHPQYKHFNVIFKYNISYFLVNMVFENMICYILLNYRYPAILKL